MSKPTYKELEKRVKELEKMEIERKQAEEALRKSEEKYRNLFNSAKDGIFIQNINGNFLDVNKSACEQLGYTKEELIKMNPADIEVSKLSDKVSDLIERLKHEGSYIIEGIHRRKDGTIFPVEISSTIIEDNRELSIISVVRDITERKKAEEALRENEEFNKALFEYNPIQTIVLDLEGRVINFNQAKRTSGDKLPNIGDVMYRDYAGKHENDMYAELIECIKTNKIKEFPEQKYCNKFLSIKISPFDFGAIIISQDITERKKAEEALRESEEKYRQVVKNANDAIFIAQDGFLKFFNKKTVESLNCSESELKSKPFTEFIHPDDRELVLQRHKQRLLGKELPNIYTFRLVHKNNNLVLVELNTVVITWNNRPATLNFLRDITKRRQLEEHLQIRQRMDSLGTLAGGIAHDFNNILTGIMGYIDILNLESDGFTETQKEYLKNAEKVCDRAAELINKFQTLSKGTISEKTNVDIYETAKEVFDVLKETTNRLIEKKIDIEPGKYYVKANPSELNQVFMNLGTNAVQAIEERGVKQGDYIKITAKEHRSKRQGRTGIPEGEYIYILFEDNGKGMSDEVRRRAFDPLFTTREKSKKRGQGLGLAMVYNIVTRTHNGYIDMESKERKGTKIHIYLPKTQSEKEAEVDEEVKGIKGGNEVIFVVDDEEIILRLAETILKKCGYNVKTAIDGEQALKIYKKYKNSVDAIILDLTMPRMSGKMVFERMLNINPDVKVIISSGHSDEYAREGLLSRAKGHVKKPYKLADLTQTVRTVLDL